MEKDIKVTHKVTFSKDGGLTWDSADIPAPKHTVYEAADGIRYIKWDDEKGE